MLVRFNAPLPANPRMENFFERAPFGGVGKDYRANGLPIQAPIAGKDGESKFSQELVFNVLKLYQIVGSLIGIKEFGVGKDLPQTPAEGALACGNSACDSNRWHW